jgi:hypothetical protein
VKDVLTLLPRSCSFSGSRLSKESYLRFSKYDIQPGLGRSLLGCRAYRLLLLLSAVSPFPPSLLLPSPYRVPLNHQTSSIYPPFHHSFPRRSSIRRRNIVATVNLDCRLDLKTIALHARNAEYNPKRFAAVIMRIRDPKTTALIFASGKMVVTGAKSEDDSRLASRK